VLTVTETIGNIFHDKELGEKFELLRHSPKCEVVKISRSELEKTRLRVKTNQGTDLGLILNSAPKLYNGDVLLNSPEKMVVIEQIPEKVISIKIKKLAEDSQNETSVILGHIIGNRHRPIQIDKNGIISFPILADSEVEVFKKLFSKIINQLEIKVENRIFEPKKEMDVHEH